MRIAGNRGQCASGGTYLRGVSLKRSRFSGGAKDLARAGTPTE
jgi:hypothetical protein